MRRSRAHLIILSLALADLATAAAARSRSPTDGDLRPAGPPVDCIRSFGLQNTRVLDDRTIDFVLPGGKIYRNVLPQPCPQLGFFKAFTHTTTLDRYCSTDTITVFITGGPSMRGATCALGQFQPMQHGG